MIWKAKSHTLLWNAKKENITEQEFKQAVNRSYAYAFATAGTVKYIWATSGIKDEFYSFDKEIESRERRNFSDDFKKQIVNLYNNGKPANEIIKEYDLTA